MAVVRSRRVRVRVGGFALFLCCGLLSCLMFIDGIAVFGKDDVSMGCAMDVQPSVGGPYYENTRILVAERTLLPLGAVCVVDSPDDTVGPQTVRLQSWPLTVGWLGSAVAALLGFVLLIHPLAWVRRKPARVSGRS